MASHDRSLKLRDSSFLFCFQLNYLSGFVDFVLIPALVNKHGCGLSILEDRRVHGESGGQRQRRLLQSAAPQRAALRTHRRRLCIWARRTVEVALNVNCISVRVEARLSVNAPVNIPA